MNSNVISQSSLTILGASYLERFQKLANMLPHRIYREGGEEKIQFPLGNLLFDRETIAGFERVKQVFEEFMGSSEGVSFNGLFYAPAINIPVRLINQLNEAGAQALVQSLSPIINLSSSLGRYRRSLAEVMGVDERLIQRSRDTDQKDRPATYVFTFRYKWTVKDVFRSSIARAFNSALKQPLFKSFFVTPGHDFVRILIKESDIETLLRNPNKGQLTDILADYLSESKNPRLSIMARFSKNFLPRRES